ncbi:MAG: endolytic transglycosylase MltG [Anaerolineae bacterium]
MNNAARIVLRLTTLVLSLSAVIFVLAGSLWYIWQDAKGGAPQLSYEITMTQVQRGIMGLYLKARSAEVSTPARPADDREITFLVEPGDTLTKVAMNLEKIGLVTDSELFTRVVQHAGLEGNIEAGVYLLRGNMTMEQVMRELQHGSVPGALVTIPEGWRAEEIAALLEELNVVSAAEFMEAVHAGRDDLDFLLDRPEGRSASLEGFLFPDTYQFPLQSSADKVVDVLVQNWALRVTPELRQKAAERGITLYEVLTMASIVEREAVKADERPVIASVFYNRLAEGMPLQADPTVQYARGVSTTTGRWWEDINLTEANALQSPYNTYVNPGLPPGPICNPGLASIEAALDPASTDYLYFRARSDGSHVFARTFEEHLANE